MANPRIKFFHTIDSKLAQLPKENGQIIFVSDTRKIYLDANGRRTEYSQIINLIDEAQRAGMLAPVTGFYFVEETKALWNYSGGVWTQLTGIKPKESVIFSDNEDLIDGQMEDGKLYIKGKAIYRKINGEKIKLNSMEWTSIE